MIILHVRYHSPHYDNAACINLIWVKESPSSLLPSSLLPSFLPSLLTRHTYTMIMHVLTSHGSENDIIHTNDII